MIPERLSPDAGRRGGRRPGAVAAVGCGLVAIAAMGFAPLVGALDPRGGYLDDVPSGTNGIAHYAAQGTGRRVDVQLVRLDPAPSWVAVPPGRRVVAVGLRLASDRAADVVGCRVWLAGEDGVVDAVPVPVAGSGCDAGVPRSGGPVEVLTTTYLAVPRDVVLLEVRVGWEPPEYARFRAL